MSATVIVLLNQEVVLGEHQDDRNLYFSENQWDVEVRNAHHSHSSEYEVFQCKAYRKYFSNEIQLLMRRPHHIKCT